MFFSWNIFKIQHTPARDPGVFRSEVELKRFNDWLCLHVCVITCPSSLLQTIMSVSVETASRPGPELAHNVIHQLHSRHVMRNGLGRNGLMHLSELRCPLLFKTKRVIKLQHLGSSTVWRKRALLYELDLRRGVRSRQCEPFVPRFIADSRVYINSGVVMQSCHVSDVSEVSVRWTNSPEPLSVCELNQSQTTLTFSPHRLIKLTFYITNMKHELIAII